MCNQQNNNRDLTAKRVVQILARKLDAEGIPVRITESGDLLVDKNKLLDACERYNKLYPNKK